jgi:hypothetical protein
MLYWRKYSIHEHSSMKRDSYNHMYLTVCGQWPDMPCSSCRPIVPNYFLSVYCIICRGATNKFLNFQCCNNGTWHQDQVWEGKVNNWAILFVVSFLLCFWFDMLFGHRCEMNACTKANLAINDYISWMYFECWQMFIVCIGRLSFLKALTKTSKEVSNLHWSNASDLII